ncbi:TonB-dependent receptor plug domain-containing protein [Chryseobacterium sp. A301]
MQSKVPPFRPSLFKWVSLLFVLIPSLGFAQLLEGVVLDKENRVPLTNVRIQIENTQTWTLTDRHGLFRIKYQPGETLVFNRSNLISIQKTYSQIPSRKVAIEMDRLSARIAEVTLSQKKKQYSEIEIREEALKNIQAFSVNEVLEQLPGQKLMNLNLNEFKPIAFRTVTPTTVSNEGFGNKSFGTSVVIDGIPLSNNENMQTYNSTYSGLFSPNSIGFGVGGGSNGYFSNSNYGVDLREISTDNIEKIEVIQGVASARYGDLTSGVIAITQKKGETPLRAYGAFRNGTQEYNLSKGFKLSEKAGFLNLNVNYLDSNTNPRTKFNVYQRLTTNAIWSWNSTNRRLLNTFSVSYSSNLDDANFEQEDTSMKITSNKKRDLRLSNTLKWRFEDSFFDNLNFRASYSSGYQFSHDSQLVNIGGEVVGTSTKEGVYQGYYTPVSYRQTKEVEGKPIHLYSALDLGKKFQTGKWNHNTSLGIDFSLSDNKGQGRLGSPETMQNQFANGTGGGGIAFRPYNFGDNVKAESQVGLYVEDNIYRKFDSVLFNLSVGLRADYQNENFLLAPRINTYVIYNNFKLRGAFGISSKSPSLNMIYTGPRVFDVVLGDVRLPGYYNLSVVQTFIDQADNKNLKPSRGIRSEIGMDYKFPFGNIALTAFYNKLSNGFTTERYATRRDLADIEFLYNGASAPTYEISGYSDYYFIQNKASNNLNSSDRGLELLSSINRLFLNSLSLDLQASYTVTKSNSNTDSFYRSKDPQSTEIYGLYRSYETTHDQLILGGALNYRIPKAGMIFSLRSQHYLIDGNAFYNPNTPYAYLNRDLDKILLTPEQISDPNQFAHIKSGNTDQVENKLDKVYHNLNLKITKEFRSGFRLSFYGNNFLDLKQTTRVYENGQYVKRLQPGLLDLSFGAKIEYEF